MDALLNEVLATLEHAGFPSYLVGGCVRDYLRTGTMVEDIDIATPALPEQVMKLFHLSPDTQDPFTLQFGTVRWQQPPYHIEVTTMREEQNYRDQRHPSLLHFITDPQRDAARRDFTINALYLARDGTILDYYHGQEDLSNHVLRCIGDPIIRMYEDPLRVLRALRFQDTLSLIFSPDLLAAIQADGPGLVSKISPWRMQKELEKWRKQQSNTHIKAIFRLYNLPYPSTQRSVNV